MIAEAEVYFHPPSLSNYTPSSSLDSSEEYQAVSPVLKLTRNTSHVSFTSPWITADPTMLSPALSYAAPEFSPESDYSFSDMESSVLLMSDNDRSGMDSGYHHASLFENVVRGNKDELVNLNSCSPKEFLSDSDYSQGLFLQSGSSDHDSEAPTDPEEPSFMESPTKLQDHKNSTQKGSEKYFIPSVSEIKPGSELWVNCNTKKRGGYHCDDKYIFTLAVDCIEYMEKNRIHRLRDCLCSDSNCVYSLIGFVNKHGLSRHIKNVHTNVDVRSFCPLCLSLFFRADSLKRHNRDCHKGAKLPKFAHFEWLAKMNDQGHWIPFKNPNRPKMKAPRRNSRSKK